MSLLAIRWNSAFSRMSVQFSSVAQSCPTLCDPVLFPFSLDFHFSSLRLFEKPPQTTTCLLAFFNPLRWFCSWLPVQYYGRSSSGIPFQFSSDVQSCATLHDPMDCSTPGFLVLHHPPEFSQTHVHRVEDNIQPSHSLLLSSSPAVNLSQHQSLFQ